MTATIAPFCAVALLPILAAIPADGAATATNATLLTRQGTVDFARPTADWRNAREGQKLELFDRLRTLERSRAALRLIDLDVLQVNELTTLEILPPQKSDSKTRLDLRAGALYFFHRTQPRELELQTPTATAAIEGTEFHVAVAANGQTVLTVLDGNVLLSNPLGALALTNGEQGLVVPGAPPVRTAVIDTTTIIQWCLYYPGVVDVDELGLGAQEQIDLAASIAAYRSGDLIQALQAYPAARVAQSDADRIFHAALLLSVGQVEQADALLGASTSSAPLRDALQSLVATVKLKARPTIPPATASQWLAESYRRQAENDLPGAVRAVKAALAKSPGFGFAWEHLAELEFGFGHTANATRALDQALRLSPRNAQAHALKGFLLSAQSRMDAALAEFQDAIDLDGNLGNAWLGRGLCRIRRGDSVAGRADLETAAALEPNRAVLRSYLAKAFSNAGDNLRATRELALAKSLDANDPTAWLYSALINRQEYRFNDAVRDLEQSLDLNDNRRVYRSRLLLDQDRAVRSSSLATIYEKVGMVDVSVREAARAVSADYGNFSAHLFLADSFNALRDPTRFNLRYETVWFNEWLLASLLAPAGAGSLSQNISQQEYSRLFEVNRHGLSSSTDYRGDGQLREYVSQFGSFGKTSYAFDLDYQFIDGIRPNNRLSRIEWYSQVKEQATPQDSVFLITKYQDNRSQDNFQYYNPAQFSPDFRFEEFQTPVALAAYHREWGPGIHTLFLGGRLENDQRVTDRNAPFSVLTRGPAGDVTGSSRLGFDLDYRSEAEIYTAELNQIIPWLGQTTVFGGRVQSGEFDTTATVSHPAAFPTFFNTPPAFGRVKSPIERRSAYLYHTFDLWDRLLLTGGLSYDWIEYPINHRQPPIQPGQGTQEKFSPKAALVWSPARWVTVRGIYTKSLGGVSTDESYRLEPTQLAGFSQEYRTIIPETVASSVSAPVYETMGAALDFKFKTHTYLGLSGEILDSKVDRRIGYFNFTGSIPILPSSTAQRIEYKEKSVTVSLNQLISSEWSLGAQYRFIHSDLERDTPEIPERVDPAARLDERAQLHQATVYALFNHVSGFFARAEWMWFIQQNFGYRPKLPGDDFQQINLIAGYRFPRERAELAIGVLNLTGQDYRLNPLNTYSELPRDRVLMARLKLNF